MALSKHTAPNTTFRDELPLVYSLHLEAYWRKEVTTLPRGAKDTCDFSIFSAPAASWTSVHSAQL